MKHVLTEISGWIPAVILPTATFLQLFKIARQKSAQDTSIATWFLFGLANIGLYIYTDKYFSLQSIIGLLSTTIMDFYIVGMIIIFQKRNKAIMKGVQNKQ